MLREKYEIVVRWANLVYVQTAQLCLSQCMLCFLAVTVHLFPFYKMRIAAPTSKSNYEG